MTQASTAPSSPRPRKTISIRSRVTGTFPPSSVNSEFLVDSATPYNCPWKGECQYFRRVKDGDTCCRTAPELTHDPHARKQGGFAQPTASGTQQLRRVLKEVKVG
jgi:hypothetical protein